MKGFCDFLESYVKVRIEEEDEVRRIFIGWVFFFIYNYQEVYIKNYVTSFIYCFIFFRDGFEVVLDSYLF